MEEQATLRQIQATASNCHANGVHVVETVRSHDTGRVGQAQHGQSAAARLGTGEISRERGGSIVHNKASEWQRVYIAVHSTQQNWQVEQEGATSDPSRPGPGKREQSPAAANNARGRRAAQQQQDSHSHVPAQAAPGRSNAHAQGSLASHLGVRIRSAQLVVALSQPVVIEQSSSNERRAHDGVGGRDAGQTSSRRNINSTNVYLHSFFFLY